MSSAETAVLETVVGLAQATGDLLLDYFQRGGYEARLKADFSVVTDADLAADRFIADEVSRKFPDDSIVSEELNPVHSAGRDGTWVVDPLDGTTNFALRLPIWGVSLLRMANDGSSVAVAYFPALGELYAAESGSGATLNGEPIRVAAPDETRPYGCLACCSRALRRYELNLPLKVRMFGSAVYSLCSVARGSAALAVETTPRVWDVAAASILVREAGGLVEPLEGVGPFPLDPTLDYQSAAFPTVASVDSRWMALAREKMIRR